MKFFMKQKVFSLKDKFFLTDEQAANRYYVEGDFSLVNRRKIIDVTTNTIVAVIEDKPISLLPTFYVIINQQRVLTITKKFKLFKDEFVIEGSKNWVVKGDFGDYIYKIIENGAVKCEITKKLFSFGDQFQIEVADEGEAPLVIAAVLAIQSVLQKRSLELALD
ncbi:Conserved_hypothetical protein [Hexamita inflata]|uniref:Uncharacterized protein n=1 Tax=Hexamita inflata TaxID=28002 RepID=A0AA86UV56_9EUKA|nr:Conserved hypothetical protein [Hexamita inflata]